jgi:hypothetical protein
MPYATTRIQLLCSVNEEEAGMIDDILRQDILHGATLDGLSRPKLTRATRKAHALFLAHREEYETFYRTMRKAVFGAFTEIERKFPCS